MLASELDSFGGWLATSPLADDRIWRRELELVGDAELQLFYARASLRGLRGNAVEAISRLQSALILEAVHGRVGVPMHLIAHELPCERFDVDEFVDCLLQIRTPTRRAAVLYALEAQMTPGTVAELTWQEVSKFKQLPARLREILEARGKVRHMKLPYVFWEWATEHIAVPLLRLQQDAERAFDCPWPQVQQRYKTMLWVSGRADASSFFSLVDEVAAGRV